MSKVVLKPRSLIVFEGLDATGKSTQLQTIKDLAMMPGAGIFGDDVPLFTHQPSGANSVGEAVYRITEDGNIESPLARQFLHLASHAEHYTLDIIPHLAGGGSVFMDRCWWSTVAYGWPGVKALVPELRWWQFRDIARLPALGHMPDVVFLFTRPHQHDRHNTPAVEAEYERLFNTENETSVVVRVPVGTVDSTTEFIMESLYALGYADGAA